MVIITYYNDLELLVRLGLYSIQKVGHLRKFRKDYENAAIYSRDWYPWQSRVWFEMMLYQDVHEMKPSQNKMKLYADLLEHFAQVVKKLHLTAVHDCYDKTGESFTSLFNFCRQYKRYDLLDGTIPLVIEKFGHLPTLIIMVCQYFVAHKKADKTAMTLLEKAADNHPDNEHLWKSIIDLELFNFQCKANPTLQDKMKCRATLDKYLSIMLEKKNYTSTALFDALLYLDSFKIGEALQHELVQKLLKTFPLNPDVYHMAARRSRTQCLKLSTKNRIKYLQYYRDALQVIIDREDRKRIWEWFLDETYILYRQKLSDAEEEVATTLRLAIKGCCSDKSLPERHYITWMEFLTIDESITVMHMGLQMYPTSVRLYKSLIALYVKKRDHPRADETFRKAVEAIKEESLPLYLFVIRYQTLLSKSDVVDALFLNGIQGQPPQVSDQLKCRYLEWLHSEFNIDKVREAYEKYALDEPLNKELHLVMNKLESIQMDINVEKWKDVHENLCMQFGKTDWSIWYNYVKFVINNIGASKATLGNILRRARMLHFDQYQQFKLKCRKVPELDKFTL